MMDVYLHMLGPSRLMRGIKARVQEGCLPGGRHAGRSRGPGRR